MSYHLTLHQTSVFSLTTVNTQLISVKQAFVLFRHAVSTTMGISTDEETTHGFVLMVLHHPAIKGGGPTYPTTSPKLPPLDFMAAPMNFMLELPSYKSIKGGKCSGFPFVKSWWRNLEVSARGRRIKTHTTEPTNHGAG